MYDTEPTHSLAMLTVQFDNMVIDYPVKVAAAAAAIAPEFDPKAGLWPSVNTVAFREPT